MGVRDASASKNSLNKPSLLFCIFVRTLPVRRVRYKEYNVVVVDGANDRNQRLQNPHLEQQVVLEPKPTRVALPKTKPLIVPIIFIPLPGTIGSSRSQECHQAAVRVPSPTSFPPTKPSLSCHWRNPSCVPPIVCSPITGTHFLGAVQASGVRVRLGRTEISMYSHAYAGPLDKTGRLELMLDIDYLMNKLSRCYSDV